MTTQATTQPLPAHLIELALAESDFIGDLDHATLGANAENSMDLVCELYEDRHNVALPLALIIEARKLLFDRGWQILCEREMTARDALADAIEAGDRDAAGNAIPYDRYPG